MNWNAYGLKEIWQMLEHEDGQISWAQVIAWGKMKSLCEYQASRLRQAADELAALWPPDQSEAARLYQDVVLTMAKSLEDDADAAHRNAKALTDLTAGIAETRGKIAGLVDQLHAREAEQHQREQNRLPWWPDSGLLDQQRAELDRAAQQIMHDADVIPATAAADFRVSAGFSIPFGENHKIFDVAGGQGEPPTRPRAEDPSQVSVPRPVARPPDPQPAVPLLSAPGSEDDGPILTGIRSTTGGRPFPELGIPPPTDPVPARAGSTSAPLGQLGVGPGVAGPGGFVGGIPGAIRNQGASSTKVPYVAARAAGPPGLAVPPISPPVRGTPSARVDRGVDNGRRRRNGRRDPWAVAEGVPAVIEPSPEPEGHDPGPGVIGLDR